MFPISPILLEETVLGALLGIALLVYVAVSFMFSYHWKRFGIPSTFFHKMNRLYFLISGSLAILSLLLFLGIVKGF